MTRSQDCETAPFANGRTAVPKIQVAPRSHAARRPKSPVARRIASPADRMRPPGRWARNPGYERIADWEKEILAKAKEIRGKKSEVRRPCAFKT